MRLTAAIAVLLTSTQILAAATLCPKYGECVPADRFECTDISRSSFITRVCYAAPEQYMVIRLKRTDYHYCSIPQNVVQDLMSADSMGQYYNQNIKGGVYDCRDHPVPDFN